MRCISPPMVITIIQQLQVKIKISLRSITRKPFWLENIENTVFFLINLVRIDKNQITNI